MKKLILLFFVLPFSLILKAGETEDLTNIVHRWNETHNNRNIETFKSLYAPKVLFYGRYKDGEKCVKNKNAFLNRHFKQEIITPLRFIYYSSGTIKCSFTKRVTYKQTIKEHLCYLLLEHKDGNYFITGESDEFTDQKLGVQLELGDELKQNENKMSRLLLPGLALVFASAGGIYFYKKKKQNTLVEPIDYQHEQTTPVTAIEVKPIVNETEIVEKVKLAVRQEMQNHFISETPQKLKGDAFEKYVVDRFNPDYFELKEWRSDKFHDGIYATSSLLPDLEYHFKTNYKYAHFAVECKWRATFINGKIEWAKRRQLDTYKKFEREKRITVFIIIGVGGFPEQPESVYIIPLREIYSNIITENQMKPFYRFGQGNFYLQAENMTLK